MDKSLKGCFDKFASAWQVNSLSTEKSLEYNNGVRSKFKNSLSRRGILLATGIYSERTAHLLNYIFNYKRWTSAVWNFHQGGGFIVDCGTTVRIGKFNEVCFEMTVKYTDFPQNSENLCVVKPKIYKMVKSAIKDYMKFAFINKKIKVKNEIDDNGFIIKNVSIDELKVLIDYFNWKDVQKSYSPELIDKVFEQKTENQFVISASEVIENQIKELIEERKLKVDENATHYSKLRDRIMKKLWDTEAKIKDEYDKKIKELENQIKEMRTNF
jgi:hypothetical protein